MRRDFNFKFNFTASGKFEFTGNGTVTVTPLALQGKSPRCTVSHGGLGSRAATHTTASLRLLVVSCQCQCQGQATNSLRVRRHAASGSLSSNGVRSGPGGRRGLEDRDPAQDSESEGRDGGVLVATGTRFPPAHRVTLTASYYSSTHWLSDSESQNGDRPGPAGHWH